MRLTPVIILLSVLSFCVFNACMDETFRTDPDTNVVLKTDTLAFDTIFSTVGSVTRYFKIHNPYTSSIKVAKIQLEGKAGKTFRLNIDGESKTEAENLEIGPKDSLYVFVEATVNPTNPLEISPFIIEDYVHISMPGGMSKVLLSVYGQNANYIPSSKQQKIYSLCTDFNTIVFDDPKPYVIYGGLVVDSCHLEIPAGARIYVHGGIGEVNGAYYNYGFIGVTKNGSLKIEGDAANPVVIQGDRLEQAYENISGQWAGIYALADAQNISIKHAEIINSIVGIQMDSNTIVDVRSTKFINQAQFGIAGYRINDLYLENCLLAQARGNAINVSFGGNIRLNYCTIVNNQYASAAIGASDYRCIENTCQKGFYYNPMRIEATNCIFTGIQQDQFAFIHKSPNPADFKVDFKHSLYTIKTLQNIDHFKDFETSCSGCIRYDGQQPLFNNKGIQDFYLDTASVARNAGIPISDITEDLEGNDRSNTTPDLGCFEYTN